MLFLLGHIFQIVTINLHYFTENKVDKLLIILCYSLFFLAFYLVYCTVSIVYCSVYIHNKTREWYLYCCDSEASSLYNVCVALTNVITVLFSYRNREALPVQYIYTYILHICIAATDKYGYHDTCYHEIIIIDQWLQ